MKRIVAPLLGTLAVAAGAVFGLAWIAVDSILRPARQAITRSPAELGLPFEEVAFTSSDGVGLRGWWIPAERPRGGIVLLHGFGSDRTELLDHAPYLHEAGFDLLLFDLRACGESGGELSTLGWREQDDLRAAIDLVEARTADRPVMAMGFSLGAATAVLEGADDPRVRAVVANALFTSIDDITWRAFPHFSRPSMPSFPFAPVAVLIAEMRLGHASGTIKPLDAIGRLAPRPILLITGTRDELATPTDVDRLWAVAGAGAQRWDVLGGAHPGNPTEPFLLRPAEYRRRVLAFFDGALGAPAPDLARPGSPL